jgi:hypothetical protein
VATVVSAARDWLSHVQSPAEQDDKTWFLDHCRSYRLTSAVVRVTRRDSPSHAAAWPGGDLGKYDHDAFGARLFAIAEEYQTKAAAPAKVRRRSILSRLLNR